MSTMTPARQSSSGAAAPTHAAGACARGRRAPLVLRTLAPLLLAAGAAGQVTFERLLNADAEPQNWLTYSGTYSSNRYTTLDQITPENVDQLELAWIFQANSLEPFQATPLVVDGIMYLTEPVNNVVALDAKRGSVFWKYEYTPSPLARPCCGAVNRGVAILDDTLFLATVDGNLIAVDAIGGAPIWKTTVADPAAGLRPDPRPPRHQGQGHRRGGGRRVRHPRLHRRLRRRHRRAGVALLHHSRGPASPGTRRGRTTRGAPGARRRG